MIWTLLTEEYAASSASTADVEAFDVVERRIL
jgi:hypothetical protein